MEGYRKEANETLRRVLDWTQHACECHLEIEAGMAVRCSCWDSNRVFIRLNRFQCRFVTLQLTDLIGSVCHTPPQAANGAQELRRISRMAELFVEECRCTQWLLKALELTVGADYFLEILRDSKEVLYEAWSGSTPSNTGQEFLHQLSVEAARQNKLDRDELKKQLEELTLEPSNGDITTHGDLARFLKRKFFDSSETLTWHPPELSKFRTNINTLEISPEGAAAQVKDLKLLGKAYAVKMPRPNSPINLESDPCAFRKEAELLEKYRNPHLVRFIGFWNVNRMPFIVEERMDLDLEKLIDRVKNAGLELRPLEVIELVLPVAKVIRYLHDQKVAHRDLKLGNIMCCLQQNCSILCTPLQNINIKLIDLGDAEVKDVSCFSGCRNVGSTKYMAPEIFQEASTTSANIDLLKADVFSFGVIVLKLLTGLTLKETGCFGHVRLNEYKEKLKVGERPNISPTIPDCLRLVIESCWVHDPQKRPCFDDICRKLVNARLELSTEEHSRRKSCKTYWLDMVRNVKMYKCLHSMPHLVRSLSRTLLAPLIFTVFLYCIIWSCLHTATAPKQQCREQRPLLPMCMDLKNPSCVAALDSLLASQG